MSRDAPSNPARAIEPEPEDVLGVMVRDRVGPARAARRGSRAARGSAVPKHRVPSRVQYGFARARCEASGRVIRALSRRERSPKSKSFDVVFFLLHYKCF